MADKAPRHLSELVTVRTNGLRSIHLERDVKNDELLHHYLLTAQSRSTLDRIIEGATSSSPARAWTLTGPYGTGKSLFAVFLMNQLAKTLPTHPESFALLASRDPILSQKVSAFSALGYTKGLFPVPITAGRESLVHCLARGMRTHLSQISDLPELLPLYQEIDNWEISSDARTIVKWMEDLSAILSKESSGYKGILIIIDEMGKILEHASAHTDEVDLSLLQEIAEFANRSGSTPLIFMGIFHQAFDEYARSLDQTSRREWDKVQGRFQDIPFQEPPCQQIRLVAETIRAAPDAFDVKAIDQQAEVARRMVESGWLPSLMASEELVTFSRMAYPLHPTVLVALPYLFRKLAQSERSIFAYLSLDEPYGFQEFLRNHSGTETVRLPDLFDYFLANYQYRLYASSRGRALTETYERLQREAELEPLHVDIMKTAGMLLWLEEFSHIKADKTSIVIALESPDYSVGDIHSGLNFLTKKSLLIFRKFNQSYAVFQGSDIDIEERTQDARRALGSQFSLADEIQRFTVNKLFIARRHSFDTGTLRYFSLKYVDSTNYLNIAIDLQGSESGLLLLCLPQNPKEAAAFDQWARTGPVSTQPHVVVGVAQHLGRLADLAQELRSLEWVRLNTPALASDITASKELRSRVAMLHTLIEIQLEQSLKIHSTSATSEAKWFHKGKKLNITGRSGLSQHISEICDELYPSSPIIRNEIINRRYVSTQGAGARRTLIEAILTKGEQPQLGIEGFPPERSIYECILNQGKLHRKQGDEWVIAAPPKDDPLRLTPVWNAIADFVFRQPLEPRLLMDLYHLLSRPPYGLTDGVIPLLLSMFYAVHKNELTLYREGSLLPEPGIPDWEVLLRRPELFAIVGCRVQGGLQAIVERFARAYQTEPAVMPVVRVLVSQINSLSDFALHTQQLPEPALAVRQAVLSARSPEQLLFVDLPSALGLAPFTSNTSLPETDVFFDQLNQALGALNSALTKLRIRSRDVFLKACHLQVGQDGWDVFVDFTKENAHRCTQPRLEPLFHRAAEASTPQAALDSALALIANRPVKSWSDMDEKRFVDQAQAMGDLMVQEVEILAPWLLMTPEQLARSEAMADEVLSLTTQLASEDAQALAAALARIARRLRSG